MNIIRPFSKISKSDTEIAGGKGASLGEMVQVGIPVPDGFVILAEAFEKFLDVTDLGVEIDAILQTVNKNEIRSVEHASEKIQFLILRAKMPDDIEDIICDSYKKLNAKYVAVRSSATAEDSSSAAWAGQLESFLNTTDDNLLEKVQHCWASLFTPRAIFYRFEKGFHTTKISVAVVVQKMVNSEVSGIAFSVHPVTEDPNQLIIEAGLGLGEAIVSGAITPDSYVVKKDTEEVVDVNVSTQTKALYRAEGGGNEWRDLLEQEASTQVLNEYQIKELSKIIITIENHYGFPCDIEWALEDGRFYVVQSRPITTLSTQVNKKEVITLSKYMSREHSLFYANVWNESNRDLFDEYISGTNIKNILFARNEIGILEVFFDLKELDTTFNKIGEEITRNPKILDKVIERHDYYWKKLTPYVIQKQKIQTTNELKEYYNNWVRWWAPMAYVFMLPEVEKVPKDLRTRALKVREETQEYSDVGDEVYLNFIKDKYPQFLEIANLLKPEEVYHLDSLSEKEVEIIKERARGYAIATVDGISVFGLSDDIYKELDDKNIGFEKAIIVDEKEIKGSTAYVGKVCGVVKTVRKVEDIGKITEGDVLVTPMTDPRYVVSMQKAVAIVTDEGGITCHAAIVARELKKPCIIGTKVATQVLNDGDLVEVDADNGVVRVLDRLA